MENGLKKAKCFFDLSKCPIKKIIHSEIFTTGMAIFSMFFGAGNVIFPLVIGRYAGDKNFYAVLGFLITAVGVPFLGLISMVLFNGDYRKFFNRLGKVPGVFIVTASMALIGPLAAIPRCVALSYTTIHSFVPSLTLFYFSFLACIVIYTLAVKKGKVIDILGRYLSPILLLILTVIIIKGFISGPGATPIYGRRRLFLIHGLLEGYNTMDLFAGFFFSTVVIAGLSRRLGKKRSAEGGESVDGNSLLKKTFLAGSIGISLLGLIYAGFSYVSAFYSESLAGVEPDALINAVAFYTLGPLAGVFACVAVSLACLTTAIALSVVFSEFIRKQIFANKIGYKATLLMTMVVVFAMSNIGFAGIVRLIAPVLFICYPALIVLAIINIAYKLFNVKTVKIPVFLTFAAVVLSRLIKAWF